MLRPYRTPVDVTAEHLAETIVFRRFPETTEATAENFVDRFEANEQRLEPEAAALRVSVAELRAKVVEWTKVVVRDRDARKA